MPTYIYPMDPEVHTVAILQKSLECTGEWLGSSVSSTRDALSQASTGVLAAEKTICSREAQVAATLATRGDKATNAAELMQNFSPEG